MKKLIYLLLIINFVIVSFLSIKQFEFSQFQSFNYHNNSNLWNIDIEQENENLDRAENYNLLIKVSMAAEVNLQRISYEKNDDNEDKIVYYVSLYDPELYFQEMSLKKGSYLRQDSDKADFLSTKQTNSDNQVGQLEIFHSFDPIEIRPMIAAEQIKDIKGIYTIDDKEKAENFRDIAAKNGFSLNISKEQSPSIFTEYPYQDMIYIVIVVLCLLITLAMFYDIVKEYKTIAIRYMHGDNSLNIGVYLLRRYIALILNALVVTTVGLIIYLYFYNQFQQFFSFILYWSNQIIFTLIVSIIIILLTWLGTKQINISQMIKNKRPVKLLFFVNLSVRLILTVFLILGLQQAVSVYQELKSTTEQQEKWEILKDYSYLGVISQSDLLDLNNNKEKQDKFIQLFSELESLGAFYISPSLYYINHEGNEDLNSNPWGMEGKKVEINGNYLLLNPIYDVNNKRVEVPESTNKEITVLVPDKYTKFQEDIVSTLKNDYKGILSVANNENLGVNLVYVQDNQSYFSFSTNFSKENDYEITDPIAVIVNAKFDPFIMATAMSKGYGYYTKNSSADTPFEKTITILNKYNFDNIWEPVSVAYAIVEQKIETNQNIFQIIISYSILFMLLAILLLFFSAMFYIEMNKQLLALQWIFGYNFFEKHIHVYLFLIAFWYLSFMICFSFSSDMLLLTIVTLGLLLLDFIFITVLLLIKEHSIIKNVLIEK